MTEAAKTLANLAGMESLTDASVIKPAAMPLHVAVYLPSLNGGGAERAMLTLANALASRGHKVELVLASATGPYLMEVRQQVRVIDLRSRRVSLSILRLAKHLRSSRPDVLVSAMNYANVAAVVAHALARVDTRMVVSERTNISGSSREWSIAKRLGMIALMRWAYRRAEAVVAVSHGVADDISGLLKLNRDRISVIYNPVVTDDLIKKASDLVEHPWFAERDGPVLIAAGRLTAAKDYPTLLRAVAIARKRINCRIIILGDGELRPDLEALASSLRISDSVHFEGFVANPFAWMAKADLFVLSSAWEGLPNVLIQSMACGTPVVSTDCASGPREILENGKWGALVPVGDSEGLAKAIIDELSSPHCKKEDLIKRAESFGVEASVQKYLATFRAGAGA